MRSSALALRAVVGFGLCSRPALLQQKGGGDETGPYRRRDRLASAVRPPGLHPGLTGWGLRRIAEPDISGEPRRDQVARSPPERGSGVRPR